MNPPVQYLQTPATITNEAIDMLGQSGKIIGDITDGTTVAEAARRFYGQGLRQLLRTAPWDFCRKQAKLTLLGDVMTSNPPLGVSKFVERPWGFAYAWPIDAVMGRWLPWDPSGGQPEDSNGIPLTTGGSATVGYGLIPGRFLVGSSDQYPIETGNLDWDQLPDLQRTQGLGPINRKIILTNCCHAHFVYTRFEPTIEVWDSLFRQAFVTMMALALVQTLLDDPKERIAQRDRLIPILRNAIADARVANGNESGYPQSVDHTPDWITARSSGSGVWGSTYPGFGGTGVMGNFGSAGGWESMNFSGSVF